MGGEIRKNLWFLVLAKHFKIMGGLKISAKMAPILLNTDMLLTLYTKLHVTLCLVGKLIIVFSKSP